MKYEKVIGKQAPDGWVLFKLPNGTAAWVDKDGSVGFFYSWAQALRFTMVDARGTGCVPADQLRDAIAVLKKTSEDNPEYKAMSDYRKWCGEETVKLLGEMEAEHEEWCRNAETRPDGSIVWGYDD